MIILLPTIFHAIGYGLPLRSGDRSAESKKKLGPKALCSSLKLFHNYTNIVLITFPMVEKYTSFLLFSYFNIKINMIVFTFIGPGELNGTI